MDNKELKQKKKAYRKAKRKAKRPFGPLTIVFGIIAWVLVVAVVFLTLFDNTIAAFSSGTFNNIKGEDENAIRYASDYNSVEDMVQDGLDVCKQVEAEGAALLKNDNNALPLEGAKVTLFSNSSTNLVYGGTGSGNVDASSAKNLKQSLEAAGITVNPTMWDFYNSKEAQKYARKVGGTVSLDAAVISECPWNVYTKDALDSVKDYSDAAVVVFSRVGGEGADCTYNTSNYLSLNDDEKEMMKNIANMKANGEIKKVVILINSANPLQVDFLKNNEYGVDAALWIGDVGISGVDAIGEILAGKVNPSGRLVDTYCYDNYSSPAMANFTPVTYSGDITKIPDTAKTYMLYQEGIYVGYKYYETRYEDYVMQKGNAGEYNYNDIVAYAFGHGLSYTDFKYSDMNTVYDAATDSYKVTLKVTNTGNKAGKETVQIYSSTPYTDYDKANGIEKASVNLVGFGKTNIIEAGQSETITVNVNKKDLASYDSNGAKTYILDAGDYYLTAAKSSHDAVNNVLAAKGYTVSSTNNRMDADGNKSLVYNFKEANLDTTTYSKSKNGTPITNQLSESDINTYSGAGGQKVTYLSRSDWNGTWPKTVQLELTDKMIEDLQLVKYKTDENSKVTMPTLGAKNGIKLAEMIGLPYDDPKWEKLLDQLTFDEMVAFIGDAFHWTMPVESVQAPQTRDENGPQGLTASLFGADSSQMKATAFTSEDVMAATFNTELMAKVGKVIGNNCLSAGITILYGPGNNIHRTPYGGRNFEYYSEDGFLSGAICTPEVAEIEKKGVHVAMKHFALNDSEQDRIGLGVWLTEQAARELYLKAFEAPFVEGNAGGTMVAYTRWGTTWSGANRGLMTNIMREEWGSKGLTITDNVLTQYVNGVDGLMAGGVSCFDAMLWYVTSQLPKYKNDPVIVTAMREACHHNLYAIANSQAMNKITADTVITKTSPSLLKIVTTLMIIFMALWILCLVMSILRTRKFKKENPKNF